MKRFLAIVVASMFILTSCTSQGDSNIHNYAYPILESTHSFNKDDIEQLKPLSEDICIVPPEYENTVRVDLKTTSNLLIDVHNQEVLYAEDIFKKIYPASITKIMTAILLIEHGDLEEEVIVESEFNHLVFDAKRTGLQKGDVITAEDLLYAILLDSGNDSAIVVAEYIGGSVEHFVEMMNQRAIDIGAVHTQFANPHGLYDENQYTTAYDLYLIFNEAIKKDEFKEAIKLPYYNITYKNNHSELVNKTLMNTNLFLHNIYPVNSQSIIWGGKTGYIEKSGYNLVLLSYIDDNPYISLIIGSQTREASFEDMTKLLNSIQMINLR
ncbi:D-alanyl-D-alanine carboxypeptidase-like protein [Natranaerovirga hydrolytica]|uniref:D-alanyl-D-alanine carboxypeptidase-like protein n=1 Tax=Natranaerovirga hydrolytica TaxID=680378 RepID=A0A4R1MY11_9FIRM|nr:serine hydrolase [Natranaerovirga hydrolytica]TCK98096.1 D-alanyl-D-alanine carboxypeptidase-like protein [Natranaerovirga hydrolytica]